MKKRILSILLVLCMVLGMTPAISMTAAAAETGPTELPKVEGSGSGQGFIYHNFVETTTFTPDVTYAFLDGMYGQDDAVAQLGSGAVLEATSAANNCTKYIKLVYDSEAVATYVDVITPGKGFDRCPKGGLYKVPDTDPVEYRYFCGWGGARNCGPLYAYTYDTLTVTWDDVTVYLNDCSSANSNDSADYTVVLDYGVGKSITLEPGSYTVECTGKTAAITIADSAGNTIRGQVILPCFVIYQPGGLNVTNMPADQGMQSGSMPAAHGPTRVGYQFLHWTDGTNTYTDGDSILYKDNGDYILTAVWKDIQAPQFTCGTVEVTTRASGETVKSVIKAALNITDNEPVSECTVTVEADDNTAKMKGNKQVSVTVTDKAGNTTEGDVILTVLPSPLSFTEPLYAEGALSAILLEPGPDDITEAGIVWGVISSPTTTVNNGSYKTDSPVTEPDTSLSTTVELVEGVTYYARAYAVAGGVTYYGPQATIGDNIPNYGVFTIENNNDNTFTVSRSGGSDGAQTVYYRTVNGSAVGGTHFTHQDGELIFADKETFKTITIMENGVNAVYNDDHAATGYSNAGRTYSVEIYRVDGGAVIEDNRDVDTRTMTGNKTVAKNSFDEKTVTTVPNSEEGKRTEGDHEDDKVETDGKVTYPGWGEGAAGTSQDHILIQPDEAIRTYMQAVSQEIQFYVTFDAKEGEEGYQAVQIVAGDETDTSIYPYKGNLNGSYSDDTTKGYTALFEHGYTGKDDFWVSYRFPAAAAEGAAIGTEDKSKLTKKKWKGNDTGNYIAFDVDTEQVTTSYGASGSGGDTWYTKNVVYHYQFIDTMEPQLLAVADMGNSTYRVGDSFTVSLIFNEIVDGEKSVLEGKTISTSWGPATYAGGEDTNVLYFTGTVPANAGNTLEVTGTNATIRDMADEESNPPSVSGSITANVDNRTPSFTLSTGSISGGVGRATISNANENTTSLRYAWTKDVAMPVTGWIPLTDTELEAAGTAGGFQAMTRQDAGSGVWYLHVLGVCNENGALAYKQTSVDFGSGGGSGTPELVQPPTITVSVNNDNWATSRTITVTYANGTAEYRYGGGEWQTISGNSVAVNKNGVYAFRCVSASDGAVTASAEVSKIDTTAPDASIGAMAANTSTPKPGVYHSVTLPVSYVDVQSGVQSAEYVWSSSESAPTSGWKSVGSQSRLTYTATGTDETDIYLHLKVTDKVGNTVTVSSSAYRVISPAGANAYAPTITIGLPTAGSTGFTPWDGTTWTNETQTLEWKLVGEHTENCVVTLPDGRTTTDSSGTILVSNNGTYTVSVVDNTYGGSNSDSFSIGKIDTIAPTVTHDPVPAGWQPSAVTVKLNFTDQGGSGLYTAKYAVVANKTETPAGLTDFASNTGGNVTVRDNGTWYIYYEVTDSTAGTYGDGTPRPANTASGFVGPIQINTTAPSLDISGGKNGAGSLTLTVDSDGDVVVSKDGGQAKPVNGGSYNVTEEGRYTFTATSNAGLETQQTVQVYSVTFDSGVAPQLVVSGGTATEPSAPQKSGYTFDGWGNGQTEWDFAAPVTGNLTLTAKWTLNTPSVELKPDKNSAAYGDTITLTATLNYDPGDSVTFSYAWYRDENTLPIANKDDPTLILSDVTDSGSYKVKVTAKGGEQIKTVTSSAVDVNIAPCPVALNWNYTGPFAYDGKSHTVAATISNLVGNDICQLTYTGTSAATAVGDYKVEVTGLGNGNYTLDGAENTILEWQITPAPGKASVTMESWTYGDTAKAPVSVSESNGTNGVTYRYTGITSGGVAYDGNTVPTDAGTYTVTATFPATDSYNAVIATDDFTIAPRRAVLTWSAERDFSYDGNEHTVTATISNLVTGDSCELFCENHKMTNAGTYTARVAGLGNPNYTLDGAANTTLEWRIIPAPGEASVTMADWIYGKAASAPVPVSATNGTDNVTYHYDGRNGTSYNSNIVPTDAGQYTVTATFDATDNYDAVTVTAEFTVGKKAVAVIWLGLTQVYGDGTAVRGTLSDVVNGDDVAVDVAGAGQTAGSYDLTATLTGTDAANYTLKNNEATLTIQPKPVIFTVADNTVQADESVKNATITADDGKCAYTVTYRQDGKKVPNPKAVGSYEIWVEITNPNYRHTDGSDFMQVGILTITQAPLVVYAASFAGGESAEGTAPAGQTAPAGGRITLPANPFIKSGYRFSGWMADGGTRLYQPGDRFTMPARDVDFTAQWQDVFEVSGIITEEPPVGTPFPAESAVVSLWLGANKIGETTTKADGTYKFENLIPGVYNLVVTKDVRTVTSKVEITAENKTCDATLPKGATNSIVEVTPGSPDIVVGQLDTVFEKTDETVYTQDDKNIVDAGGKVEITFTAAEKKKTEVTEDLQKIQAVSGDSNLALVMDYKLEKEVFDRNDMKIMAESIAQSNVRLEVLLPLPTELQGKNSYSVYRVHSKTGDDKDKRAQELREGEANKNELGEYFTVSNDKTKLTLYVKCFSTYAVGYTESTWNPGGSSGSGSSALTYPPIVEQPEHGSVTVSPKNPEKGDQVTITPTPDKGYTVDEVIVTGPDGKPVEVVPNGDGTYTFSQPDGKVTITVAFRETTDTFLCPRDESCPMTPFTDADRSAWYHDGVHYCVEKSLMVGTGKTTFAPDIATTRGMIVTILWRLEGSPIVGDPMDYDDVEPEDWYGEAVRWADSAGVITGYGNGKFGPNDPITREQMAAMLWRYAGSQAVDGGLSPFADGAQTSRWAKSAMIWAVEQGLIAGTDNGLLIPQGQATRAQAATILMRFAENMAQ